MCDIILAQFVIKSFFLSFDNTLNLASKLCSFTIKSRGCTSTRKYHVYTEWICTHIDKHVYSITMQGHDRHRLESIKIVKPNFLRICL